MQKHKFTNHLCIFIAVVTLSQTTTYAQQRFSAGPRLGVNLSKYTGANVQPNNTIAGLTAGGFIMYSSLNHFGISADLLYSQKGGKFVGLTGLPARLMSLNGLIIWKFPLRFAIS